MVHAQGIAFPAVHSIISQTVPRSYQSTAVAAVTAASYAGSAAAAGISPWIITHTSWQAVFYVFGASALLWLPFWLFTPLPDPTPSVPRIEDGASIDTAVVDIEGPQEERNLVPIADDELQLLERLAPVSMNMSLPVSVLDGLRVMGMDAGFISLVQRKEVWAIGVAQYCQSWGLYVLLNWLPTFFTEKVCHLLPNFNHV